MTNEEARDQIVIFMCDEQKVINDRDKQALDMAIKALETIPKYKDAYNKGWCDGAYAVYEHLKMCEEEQELKYCDRNICISNEYNGIGCDECEVTKSQKQSGDLISRDAVLDLISKFILEIHSEGGRDLNAHTNDVLRQILRNVGSDRVLHSVNPQEPKADTWSIKDVADTLAKHGLIVEQEPNTDVLDKIRAEIEQTTSRYTISRERGAMGQVEWSDRLIKESEILEILDKYKAESEVQ